MPNFALILAAAGASSRFRQSSGLGGQRKKVFQELKGRPVWLRSAEPFLNREDLVQSLVAVAPDDVDWFREKYRANLAFTNVEIVPGGAERADTVQNALARVRGDVEFVAIHDAARPLIVKEWIDSVFAAAVRSGAAIPAVRVAATLKRVSPEGTIEATVPRDRLWQAQTPQVFRVDLLREAFARRGNEQPTDEAQLVESLGRPVTVVEGSSMNLKITTAEDFRMAEALLDALPKPKGFRALHPFADEEPRFP